MRLEKVLDRYGTAPKQIQIDDVIIDTVSHIVTKNGEEIYLKPMEYNCLMVFVKTQIKHLPEARSCRNCGRRNSAEKQELWMHTLDASEKKLSWQDKIKTIPRIGYRLEVDL